MKRIGVLTSGGDSPGMNAGIRAVVRAAHHHDMDVSGIGHGYQGLIDDEINPLTPRDVGGIINRGGTMLHSARCDAFLKPDGRAIAAQRLRDHGIEALVVIGGDGTYRGAECLEREHGIRCVGMPGTIDNDIGGTDFTIGFDTALNTAIGAIDKLRDTAESHDRIFFVEVMGRHNGYIAMMSGLAGGAIDILVPETPTDIGELVNVLESGKQRGKKSMIVVVAEGDDAGGAADIARQVAERSSFKDTRYAVIGHLQRGGAPTAADRILASQLGVAAVGALAEGKTGLMVGVSKGEVVFHPFSAAWETPTTFDPKYLKLMKLLAE
jgi:6-phosphofructokinase 1